MLAAILLTLSSTSDLTEILPAEGWEMGDALGGGPNGRVIYEAYRGDETRIFIWEKGKSTPYPVKGEDGFGLDENAAQGFFVNGSRPDGAFFGGRVYGFNGASSTWMVRPFLGEKGAIKPVPMPPTLKNWNDLVVVGTRPDGAFLIKGVEATMNSMMGDPKLYIDQLMWVKDGKILQEIGKASQPLLDRKGTLIAATQFTDEDGDITGTSIYSRRAHVVDLKNGKLERITDGEAVAILDNGDVIVKKSVFESADQQYDAPTRVSYHRMHRGVLTEFAIPGKPELTQDVLFDPSESGIVEGWNGEVNVIRSFDAANYREIKLPKSDGDWSVISFVDGYFVATNYDEDNNPHAYLGSVR